MWECGLKRLDTYRILMGGMVTPYVGVWIETQLYMPGGKPDMVTPYVGVWIETVWR